MTLQPDSLPYSQPDRLDRPQKPILTALQAKPVRTCARRERTPRTQRAEKFRLYTRTLPVRLSGLAIGADVACQVTCQVTCRPVMSRAFSYSLPAQRKRNEMGRNLRAEMPTTAAWIDSLREAFGADQIEPAIRRGMKGGSDFYASENGHVLGAQHGGKCVSLADMVLAPPKAEENAATARKNARKGK